MASVYRNVFGMTTAVSAALLMASAAGAQVNPEVEPNDSKATATVAASGGAGMVTGDTITGTTTGLIITVPPVGLTSADYFRVKTAAMPLAIYRHRLQLASPTLFQTGTIRALNQTGTSALGGTIGTTDNPAQTAPTGLTNGVPARAVQWYGFGKQEEIYYRVTGTTSSTGSYTSTLSSVAIAPVVFGGSIFPGSVTIARVATNTADVDYWVYDANFNPVPGAGRDDGTPNATLTTSLAVGTYYLALSNFNFANNQPASVGESSFGNVLDFANAVSTSSTALVNDMNMTFASSAGTVSTAGVTKAEGFQVVFVQFVVAAPVGPTNPSGTSTNTAGPLCNSASNALNFTVLVTGGQNPASTGLGVTADLSSLGGATNVLLNDNGLDGDVTAGDSRFSANFTLAAGATAGSFTPTYLITDAEARTGNGSFSAITVNNTATPPVVVENLGDLSLPAQVTRTFDIPAAGIVWYSFTLSSPVSAGAGTFLDIDTVGSAACPDTEIGLFSSANCGSFVATDDDSGPGNLSQLSFGAGTRPAAPQGTCTSAGVTYAGSATTLAAGTYYLAVGRFNSDFSGAYVATSTGPASPGARINLRSTVTPSNPTGAGTAIPNQVANNVSNDVVLRVATTPGQFPISTGLGVTVNTALIGGGTVTLLDDGVAPDTVINDGIFNGTVSVAMGATTGNFALPFTVTDAEARMSSGTIALVVREASGACCVTGSCSITTLSACVTAGGTFLGDGAACAQAGTYAITGSVNALEDISATGTVISAAPGDDATFPVTLSFPFPFYGTPQNSVNVSTNGNLQFPPSASTTFTNGDLPSVAAPNGALYPCWDDFNFNVNTSDGLFTETRGTAGVDLRQIIQWNNVAEFGSTADTNFNTFQAVLFENGSVEFRYGTMSATIFAANDSTVGVENAGGTAATQLDESLLASNTAVVVVYSDGVSNCPSGCAADFNGDGTLDPDDLADYIGAFFSEPAPLTADFNGDGTVDPDDLADYIGAFFAGCP